MTEEKRGGGPKLARFARLAWEGFRPALRLLTQPKTLAQLPRLLTEGAGPVRRMFIQAHNSREIVRFLNEGEQITFVNSFPRSGNTWVRYLLCDALQQQQWIETTTEHAVRAEKVMPDFYCEMLARRDPAIKTPGVFIKSHDAFVELRERFCGPGTEGAGGKCTRQAFNACRHLYLYRSPEDALVSLFHLYLREKYVKSKAGGDIDAFCLEALPGWVYHISSYLAASENGISVFFVRYDQLLREPGMVLGEMLGWLGIPHTGETLGRAVANTEFNKLQTVEASRRERKQPVFRRGRNGSGLLELKPETLVAIREKTARIVAQADERIVRQRMPRHSSPAAALVNASPETKPMFRS